MTLVSDLPHLCIISYLLLQSTRGSMLGQLPHALAGTSTIRPVAIAVAMRGANYFAQTCAPSLRRKVLGMRIPSPLALQNYLYRKNYIYLFI